MDITASKAEGHSTGSLLAATACWTASVRARENQRDDRLFSDPWAQSLSGEQGAAWIALRSEDSTLPIVLRTRFFDDFLLNIAAEQRIHQFVIMAAGLDTRAYRLSWPQGIQIYELDQPAVLDYKEKILDSLAAHPACVRHSVPADLTGSWQEALIRSGFNPDERSCWLLEGLLFYLPDITILKLIEAITILTPLGSWLAFDTINSAMLTSRWTKAWVEMQAEWGAPWIGCMDDPRNTLSSYGWTSTLTQAGQPDANFGRWSLPIVPTELPDFPHNWYVTACKS
jgi:methyltransferase (TIGR00027 family)